jgi:hypothetical protein
MCRTPDLHSDLQLFEDTLEDDGMEGNQTQDQKVSDIVQTDSSSSSSDTPFFCEDNFDLNIHYRPTATNIDCLAQLDKEFVETLDAVQKKVIGVGHSINKCVALHGKVSMIPYIVS